MTTRPCLIALTLALTPFAAQATISDADRAVLETFYGAANGEEWHNNDGWLEPDRDPCTWHGVQCGNRFGVAHEVVEALELPENNLSGTLETDVFEIVHERLDLSDNAIGGALDKLPSSPERVDLSNNRFTGNLPSATSEPGDFFNWYLDLSGNEFEGEIPENWDGPNWLSLANNRLEGMPRNLLEDAPRGGERFLDLSDNRFSGELPNSMMQGDFLQHNGPGRWGGGINLCWNDWTIPESVEFQEWLRDHHVGGEFEQCLAAERQAIDPASSGSWSDPDRSGEGITIHHLDSGAALIYFFTFDEHGNQQWLFDMQPPSEKDVRWREMLRTRGLFGEGLLESEEPSVEVRGSFRADRLDADRALVDRVYIIDQTSGGCILIYPPPLGCQGDSLSDRLEYHRLSQLAGTTCENQSGFQQYSGAWYNPVRSGEGFIIEVLPDDRAIVYWFTYTPDGSGDQAWMVGEGVLGSFDAVVGTPPPGPPESRIEIETVWQPVGTAFGPAFDAAEVELVDWGSLIVDFYRNGTGRIAWNSDIQGYGSGEYPIEHLARPILADCEEGESQ